MSSLSRQSVCATAIVAKFAIEAQRTRIAPPEFAIVGDEHRGLIV
jgi:hypothetical protein